MRIDSIKPDIDYNEQRIYEAFVRNIKSKMPDSVVNSSSDGNNSLKDGGEDLISSRLEGLTTKSMVTVDKTGYTKVKK